MSLAPVHGQPEQTTAAGPPQAQGCPAAPLLPLRARMGMALLPWGLRSTACASGLAAASPMADTHRVEGRARPHVPWPVCPGVRRSRAC